MELSHQTAMGGLDLIRTRIGIKAKNVQRLGHGHLRIGSPLACLARMLVDVAPIGMGAIEERLDKRNALWIGGASLA